MITGHNYIIPNSTHSSHLCVGPYFLNEIQSTAITRKFRASENRLKLGAEIKSTVQAAIHAVIDAKPSGNHVNHSKHARRNPEVILYSRNVSTRQQYA